MIYFARVGEDGPIKIGKTVDLLPRLVAHRRERRYGGELTVIAVCEGGREEEKRIHAKFAHLRTNERNAKLYGPVELFHPEKELMDYIASHCRKPNLLDTLHEKTGRRTPGLHAVLSPFALAKRPKGAR